MNIRDNIDSYRIIIEPKDIYDIGYPVEHIVDNLCQASELTGVPIVKKIITHYPRENYWEIFLYKEI